MGNLKVVMTDRNGVTTTFEDVEDGVSLMELGRERGVDGITGDCGGACACATCHLYVEGAWFAKVGAPDAIELAMLDMVEDVKQDNSRLGCQIRMTADLDGIAITAAPESDY